MEWGKKLEEKVFETLLCKTQKCFIPDNEPYERSVLDWQGQGTAGSAF